MKRRNGDFRRLNVAESNIIVNYYVALCKGSFQRLRYFSMGRTPYIAAWTLQEIVVISSLETLESEPWI